MAMKGGRVGALVARADDRRRLYLQGLGVRIGITLLLCGGVVGFWGIGTIPSYNAAALVIILNVWAALNVVYWKIGAARKFPVGDFVFHQAGDIFISTVAIHYAGGISMPYCAIAYSPPVLFAALNDSRRVALGLGAFSIASLGGLLLLERAGVVWSFGVIWGYALPVAVELVVLVVGAIYLMSLAWVAGTLGDELKLANLHLEEAGARLQEQNRDLERRVDERTAKLARATQEIEDLVHIVSHDLKNVAVAVTETARKLVTRESTNLSERGKSYADNVLEDGRTMSRMLEDLLLLFRHTEGAGARAEWVDVDAVVRQSLRQLQYQVEAKRIEVSVGPLPSVFADTQKMRHIFDNLLNNACKYVGDKKPARVEVGGEVNGTTVRFFVRDNGVGMDERQRARIFQLYHRGPVQEVEGAVQDGHGVGLAIVKRIVERYGGTIVVQSAAREGTTFEVTLPRGDGTVA